VYNLLEYGDVVFFVGIYIYCLFHPRHNWQYIAGMIVATACYVLWILARLQLGRSFTARAEARELVTTGLYSKVRNPIYFFHAIGTVAMCVAMRWYASGVFFLVVVVIFQWKRAKTEAAVLEAKFGEEYRKYRARTWF
jgi:protein-S-isoprenylcysteine O-methyltransferase Ste14